MTDFIVLAVAFGGIAVIVRVIRRRLAAVHVTALSPNTKPSWDEHFESARALLEPQGPRRVQVRPAPAPLTRIAASELMVLTTAYLCAVQEGDAEQKRRVLRTVTGRELLAGPSLVSRTLATEHAQVTGMSTTGVLNALHEQAGAAAPGDGDPRLKGQPADARCRLDRLMGLAYRTCVRVGGSPSRGVTSRSWPLRRRCDCLRRSARLRWCADPAVTPGSPLRICCAASRSGCM